MSIRSALATRVRQFADKLGQPAFAATPFPTGGVTDRTQLKDELGGTGTFNFGGFIRGEDPNAEMDGMTAIRNLDDMRRGDAQAHASLEVVKMPIRTATYEVDPSDPDDPEAVQIAEFVKWNLFDGMQTNWDDVIRQSLLMLDFGFMLFEKVWSVQEQGQYAGNIVLNKMAPRPPKTVWQWFTDEDGALLSIKQLTVKAGTYQYLDIPASKLVRFTFQQEGDNFLGVSMLRSAYPHWLIKKNLYVIDAIRAQRFGVGIPRAKLVAGYRPTADDKSAIATMLQGLSSHQHGYLIEPAQLTVDILMPQGVRGGADIMPTINHHNEQITRNILAQFLDMGGKAQGGSRALGASAMDFFLNAIEAIALQVCDVLNKQVIVDLVDMNFDSQKYPKLRPVGIHETDMKSLAAAAAALATGGLLTAGDRKTENTFRTLMGLPELAEDVPPGGGVQPGTSPAVPATSATLPAAPATSATVPATFGPGVQEHPTPVDFTGGRPAPPTPPAAPPHTQSPFEATSATPAPTPAVLHTAPVAQPMQFDPAAVPAGTPATTTVAVPHPAASSVAPGPVTATPATAAPAQAVSRFLPPRQDLTSSGDADEEGHPSSGAPPRWPPNGAALVTRAFANPSKKRTSSIATPHGPFWRRPTPQEAAVLDLREIPHRLDIARSALRNTLLDVREEQISRIASTVAHASSDATLKAPLVGKMQADLLKTMREVFAYGQHEVVGELTKQAHFPARKMWEEAQHPRDDHGEFASGGGSERAPLDSPKHTSDVAARAKALKIPPAWTNVQVSVDPKASLQATGVDAKGRTQYIYSAEHSAQAAAEKFARLRAFNTVLPTLRTKIAADLHAKSPEDREAAAVLLTIDKTGFRLGSDADRGGDKHAYGASTLEARHVKVDGDKVTFRFVGKKGVEINKTVHDQTLATTLAPRVGADKKGRLFDVSETAVRDYLHARVGDFNVKDLRTWHGTATALTAVAQHAVPTTDKEFKKAQRDVAKTVAQHLGNTPAVALKSYIDPAVWGKWKN